MFCKLLTFTITVIHIKRLVLSQQTESKQLEEFNYCLRQKQQPILSECLGQTAINYLQRLDEQDNFTLTNGFVTKRDENVASRSLVNLFDINPVDFKGIMENAGAVFSQRSLEWHMDGIYPGLMLKIGPTADANSVAEFVIDTEGTERNYAQEEPSTARILTRQYLLPVLLGLKFNLVALVPLVFTVICLLLKKSLILVKFIIFISSVLGLGGAVGSGLNSFGAFGLNGLPQQTLATKPIRPSWDAFTAYLPGKTTVYNEEYEVENTAENPVHMPYYKRNGRKIKPNKPRELSIDSTTTNNLPPDHFYDYEKLLMHLEERSHRQEEITPTTDTKKLGWKVLDIN